MSKPYLKIAESINSFFLNTVLGTIFVFHSNISQIRSIFATILAPILFPLVVVSEVIVSLFTFYRWVDSENRNLGLTTDTILAAIKAALVATAVFAGFSLLTVQSLFLAAIGSAALYQTGLALYHAYHWRKAEKNSSLRELHKRHTINNLLSATMGGIVIAGIVLTMVIAPYLSAMVLAVAGVATASLLLIATVYSIYRNFASSNLSKAPNATTEQPHVPNAETSNPSLSARESTISSESVALLRNPARSSNYYQEVPFAVGNSLAQNKEILLKEIDTHIANLEKQIAQSKRSWLECIWPQQLKRQTKINYLENAKTQVQFPTHAKLVPLPRLACQSFFKDRARTQLLYEAAELVISRPSM